MEIKVAQRGGEVVVEIFGVIKGNVDSERFKKVIDECGDLSRLEILIFDSFSITSTIIGYLNKKSAIKNTRVLLKVKDRRLYEILDELSLIDVFNVSMMG